ncbi:MAG: CCA tRNA nucleotidyltransferase [Streptococcaceae bacterium]|jgi:tRNA nucleotidyltransferase (CCA-adding enzyme)|nr:CCA tRNA nucleotidyltransferase [Streptococcaceae bacterium]
MKFKNLPEEFRSALPILDKISHAGFEVYFVGGSVRDALLRRPIHDVDIATSAYPAEIKQIFKRTIDIGIEHGTVLVLAADGQYEVTTFRTESSYTDFRRPDRVEFVSDLSEDLLRRDFTINAFAMTSDGIIIDKFDGLSDLKTRTLRAVGKAEERFNEDALRVMRGMRFAAELDFNIEEATLTAMSSHAALLRKISIERIFIELDKLLLAENWRKGLFYLNETEAWKYLPGFGKVDAACLIDRFQFKNSEQAWAWLIIQLKDFDLKDWKVPNVFAKTVKNIVSAYYEEDWDVAKIYRYGLDIAELADDLKVASGQKIDRLIPIIMDRRLQIHSKSEIVIKGADLIELGYPPGPALGRILSDIETNIVNNKLLNKKEEILDYVEKLSR